MGKRVRLILAHGVKSTWPQGAFRLGFSTLRFRIPFGRLKSIAYIVPYPLTAESDVGVNRHLIGIALAFSLFNAEVYPVLVFVHD